MIRPYLVNFSAILSEDQLSVRANISNSKIESLKKENRTPLDSVSLFKKEQFKIKLVAYDKDNNIIYDKTFDTDNYGKLELRISSRSKNNEFSNLTLFEIGLIPGLEIYLGSILPMKIQKPRKILITDFDKTLVDTRYSTPKEMYYSLNRPLSHFPNVEKSIRLVKDYEAKSFQTFVLSASPHFYEHAIRDWLYQNQIFVSNLYLKDYRDFISIFDGSLSAKDIKKQGFYKLNQLIDILLMTKLPEELVLIGDGFESDPFIYLTLKKLIQSDSDPWQVWKSIKNNRIFSLTSKQDSFFITKFYQLSELAKNSNTEVKIYIRATEQNLKDLQEKKFESNDMTLLNKQVNYYINK